jgi:hypothetical protein
VKERALALVGELYRDFGPLLAAEKLGELHGVAISRETLRHWMQAGGLWLPRKDRVPVPHQPRFRRAGFAASWSRSTAASTTGSRTAAPTAASWFTSTMHVEEEPPPEEPLPPLPPPGQGFDEEGRDADPLLGEAVKAFIFGAPDANMVEKDVMKHCLARLENYTVPKQVVFVPEVPMTSSGKVNKSELKSEKWAAG